MATLKTKLAVGIFVVIGFAVAFIAVIWLGMSHYLEKGRYFVVYFDESIQGLDRDSPVKYRGVSVGRVDSVSVAPDATLVQAVLKIEPSIKPDENFIAQLRSVGITGIMFVELDRRKPGEPDQSPRINFPSKYPVIATKPSQIRQILSEINEILKQFKRVDLAGVTDKIKITLDNWNHELAEVSQSLRQSLAAVESAAGSFGNLSENANRPVNELADMIEAHNEEVSETVREMNRSMAAAGKLVNEGRVLVNNTDQGVQRLLRQMAITLENLEAAGNNLSRAIDKISEQPSQLIFSQPMPVRKIEPTN